MYAWSSPSTIAKGRHSVSTSVQCVPDVVCLSLFFFFCHFCFLLSLFFLLTTGKAQRAMCICVVL
jgi:hypothetical protein